MLASAFSEKKERIVLHRFPKKSPLKCIKANIFMKILKLCGKW